MAAKGGSWIKTSRGMKFRSAKDKRVLEIDQQVSALNQQIANLNAQRISAARSGRERLSSWRNQTESTSSQIRRLQAERNSLTMSRSTFRSLAQSDPVAREFIR